MLDDEKTPPPVSNSGQSHQDARGLNSSKRNSRTKNITTTKTSKQKQPKNSKAKQISEMVSHEEVKQTKDPQNYTKKCLSRHMERNNTNDIRRMQQLVRALDYFRLDILGITEHTHTSLR